MSVDRRRFLMSALGLFGVAGSLEMGPLAAESSTVDSEDFGDELTGEPWRARRAALRQMRRRRIPEHRANGDERRVSDYAASFSKCLPHDELGHVDRAAYEALLNAVSSGDPESFESIPLGGYRKLANPQSAFSFELVGPAPNQIECSPAPRLDSAVQAAEMVEVYWQALLRDVPFSDYEGHDLVDAACRELSRFGGFAVPSGFDHHSGPSSYASRTRSGGRAVEGVRVEHSGARSERQAVVEVTPGTLFRGMSSGDLVGPYVSQFLWQPVPYRPMTFEQRMICPRPRVNYLGDYEEWLDCQNGGLTDANQFEHERRYIATGRDLGEYVHRDFTYQSYLSACLMLLRWSVPVDGANPYKHSHTQAGFGTFGPPLAISLLAQASQLALKAAWFQKWLVHRRLRPEALGGRIHNRLTGRWEYPLHRDLLESEVVERVGAGEFFHSPATTGRRATTGSSSPASRSRPGRQAGRSYLLPVAYPEGAPIHPSYPAGHAVVAGACVTILKALFDETFVVPDPVVATADGKALEAYDGATLTIGGELDKLASNISLGRDFAGVHYRSDATAGLAMGEQVAVGLLEELRFISPEPLTGLSFTGFDGEWVTM